MPRPLAIFVPHASDHLTDHLPHGDGLVAFEVVRRIAERGHCVHVASPAIAIAGPLPPTLHLHPLGANLSRWRYMLAVRRLFGELDRARRFDVVHQLNPVFTGISLALTGARTPVVLGSFLADWPAAARHGRRRRALAQVKRVIATLQQRHARALIVTTPGARERIVEPERHHDKIVQLPHGIDPARFPPAAAPAGPPTILFLGGLETRKGVDTLIEAFAQVRRAIPQVRLEIGGVGRQWDAVEAQIAAAGLRDAVRMLGAVERSALPALFARTSVFVMPSRGEPFGMSLLEAMASAKPVVVSDAGGPRYLVDDAGGRKVPPGDAPALATALIEIVRSPELARAMGAHNRARVEREFAWDRVIDRLEALYRRLAVTDAA